MCSSQAVPIPDALRESHLMRLGGYAVFQGLPDATTVDLLYNEAAERHPYATAQEEWIDDLEERRGGKPRRKLLTAEAGPVQDALYAAPSLADFLSGTCGIPMVPSGNRGSYSYYARAGDFLDLHRDVETCDLTMITGLYDNSDPSEDAGSLVLYPDRVAEPLSSIRTSLHQGAYPVKLIPGCTILLLGGIVPHRVQPVREGQIRVISVLCFRALT
jgi:hypothetical protein